MDMQVLFPPVQPWPIPNMCCHGDVLEEQNTSPGVTREECEKSCESDGKGFRFLHEPCRIKDLLVTFVWISMVRPRVRARVQTRISVLPLIWCS